MTKSRTAITTPMKIDMNRTATVCFATVSLSAKTIFLYSFFSPLKKLGFFSFLADWPFFLWFLQLTLYSLPYYHVLYWTGLLGFLMHGMSLAESAVLLGFHTVRMSFFVLSHVIVALFAFCTCQCNFCAHDFHLHLYYRSSHFAA